MVVKNFPAIAGDLRDAGLIPGSERSTEAGNGNALQYFCLQNPMDKGGKKSIKKKKIPWTEEPGRLQFMGLQRVGHD